MRALFKSRTRMVGYEAAYRFAVRVSAEMGAWHPSCSYLRRRDGLCPLSWYSFDVATTIIGRGRDDQAATVGRLIRGSAPIGEMLPRPT
jgi:hypothetical protein